MQIPKLLSSKAYSNKADVWSLGVILYRLAVGHYPFEDNNINSLKMKICGSNPVFPSFVSPILSDLLKKILVKQPDNRLSITDIMKHQWFYSYNRHIFQPPAIDYSLDQNILKQLDSYGINPDEAAKHVLTGEIRKDTIIYWMIFSEYKVKQVDLWSSSLLCIIDPTNHSDVNLTAKGRRQFNFKGSSSRYRRSFEPIEEFACLPKSVSIKNQDQGRKILQIPHVPIIVTRRMSRPMVFRKINEDFC